MPAPEPPAGPVLTVGTLDFDLGPRPPRCGIHGTEIVARRCTDCDEDRAQRIAGVLDDRWGATR